MLLGHDEIFDYCRGVERCLVEDDWIRFVRIPDGQQAIYQEPNSRIRTACTAGVRIAFLSNTRFVRVGLRFGASARDIFASVLTVDGEEDTTFGPSSSEADWDGTIYHQPTSKTRRFELWLPHLAEVRLGFVELEDGCTRLPAPDPTHKWLVYGDSITQGMTATTPIATYVSQAAIALDADFWNLGVGGAKFDERLAAIPDYPYDWASVAFGTNDYHCSVPLRDFDERAHALLAALTQARPGKAVFLVNIIPEARETKPNERGLSPDDYRAVLSHIGERFEEVHVVDGERLIAGEPHLFADGVHPNNGGMALYSHNLSTYIKKTLSLNE